MAKWFSREKCLFCDHEDLCLYPKIHIKKTQNFIEDACNSGVRG